MAVNHNRNIQAVTKIMKDDCRRPGIGTAVATAHGAGFIYQQANCQLGYLVWQAVFVEYLAIVPAQSMGVKPSAHDKASLLAALTVLLQLFLYAPLELPGNRYQSWRDGIVLLYQGCIYT